MMSSAPSTHPSKDPRREHGDVDERIGGRHRAESAFDRTTRPASSDPHRTGSASSGKHRNPPCRSPHGHKPEARTTNAIGKEVRETRSPGCSPTSLYNLRRPHSSLDGSTPDQTYFTPRPLRLVAWPRQTLHFSTRKFCSENGDQLRPTYLTGLQFSGRLSRRRGGRSAG